MQNHQRESHPLKSTTTDQHLLGGTLFTSKHCALVPMLNNNIPNDLIKCINLPVVLCHSTSKLTSMSHERFSGSARHRTPIGFAVTTAGLPVKYVMMIDSTWNSNDGKIKAVSRVYHHRNRSSLVRPTLWKSMNCCVNMSHVKLLVKVSSNQ